MTIGDVSALLFALLCFCRAFETPQNSRVRLDSGGPGQRAAAAGRAGVHHRPEEPDHQQPGPGHAEVRCGGEKKPKHFVAFQLAPWKCAKATFSLCLQGKGRGQAFRSHAREQRLVKELHLAIGGRRVSLGDPLTSLPPLQTCRKSD